MVVNKSSRVVSFIISLIKILSFSTLSIISTLLSVNMFKELGNDALSQFLLICAAGSLEGTKIVAFITAKAHKVQKKKDFIRKYAFYGILLALSLIASFGFILTTVQYTSDTVARSSNDDTIAMYQSQIKMFDSQIQSYLKQMAELPVDYITARAKIAQTLEEIQNKMVETQIKINELNLQESEKTKVSTSMFSLIGEVFNLSEKIVMFIILFAVSLCIEIGIISTAPDLNQLKEGSSPMVIEEKPKRKYTRSKKENDVEEESIQEEVKSPLTKTIEFETPKQPIIVPQPLEEAKNITFTSPVIPTIESIAEKVNEPLPVDNKLPEGLHPTTKEIPIRNVSVQHDKYRKFIHSLFNSNSPYLKDKDTASIDAGLSVIEGTNIFNNIATKRGSNGNFLIEFRKNMNKWVANYPKEEILKIYETMLEGGK